jgi:hypothetical protein
MNGLELIAHLRGMSISLGGTGAQLNPSGPQLLRLAGGRGRGGEVRRLVCYR